MKLVVVVVVVERREKIESYKQNGWLRKAGRSREKEEVSYVSLSAVKQGQ